MGREEKEIALEKLWPRGGRRKMGGNDYAVGNIEDEEEQSKQD